MQHHRESTTEDHHEKIEPSLLKKVLQRAVVKAKSTKLALD